MAEAALAMRDVMSQEPSFVIRDARYFVVAYLQLQMVVGGVRCDSHEFGLRPADLHPHNVGFFLKYHQCFLEHSCRWSNYGDVIRVIKINELVFTELYPTASYNGAAYDALGGCN